MSTGDVMMRRLTADDAPQAAAAAVKLHFNPIVAEE
jgi:hypothetical protein